MWKQIVVLLGIGMLGALGWADVIYVDASATGGANEQPVYFADENLKAAVEEALGISNPTPSDMLLLQSLTSSRAIENLTGIEYGINLSALELPASSISDISPLSDLTSLTVLRLHNNNIGDITPLSNLVNLVDLNLDYNRLIQDISPLSGLSKLRTLYMAANQISDISPLAELTELTGLRIYNNEVTDIYAMAGLTNLR